MHGRRWVQLWWRPSGLTAAAVVVRLQPLQSHGGRCKQQNVLAHPLLLPIEGVHTSTDKIGGSLGQIGWHAREIQQHGLLLTHCQNDLERLIKALRGEHDHVVPAVLEHAFHVAMMEGFASSGMVKRTAIAALVLIGLSAACSNAGSGTGAPQPKQAMFPTREEAEAAAEGFGCEGAHKMGDMWMVCEQHGDAKTDHGQH